MSQYVNMESLQAAARDFGGGEPFDHAVIDDFFLPEVAAALEAEFPDFESDVWHQYRNAIELKKTCNNSNAFPALTYRVFDHLNSPEFIGAVSDLLDISPCGPTPGSTAVAGTSTGAAASSTRTSTTTCTPSSGTSAS